MKKNAITAAALFAVIVVMASVSTAGTVTDIDGNVYQTVTIGTQVWMTANLKVTHYRNGDAIPNVTDSAVWASLKTGAYCNYSNDLNFFATYGRLYNWYAATDNRNLAPVGWHIPTDAEWQTLVDYLGGDSAAGGKMKIPGTTYWWSPNNGASNVSGFSALPGGFRGDNGAYDGMGNSATFWTTTEHNVYFVWLRWLSCNDSGIGRDPYQRETGISVRCVKDVSCCTGATGNVNMAGGVDLADLSALVSYLTGGGYVLTCIPEANVNGVGSVDLADLSALVSYLTGGGYVLPGCP
jgi:uncharacterized protein (TIGR02145 family)